MLPSYHTRPSPQPIRSQMTDQQPQRPKWQQKSLGGDTGGVVGPNFMVWVMLGLMWHCGRKIGLGWWAGDEVLNGKVLNGEMLNATLRYLLLCFCVRAQGLSDILDPCLRAHGASSRVPLSDVLASSLRAHGTSSRVSHGRAAEAAERGSDLRSVRSAPRFEPKRDDKMRLREKKLDKLYRELASLEKP